jgi:hypothetical protein
MENAKGEYRSAAARCHLGPFFRAIAVAHPFEAAQEKSADAVFAETKNSC